MPFFGLVWVASWVGCFFSSPQDLLKQPRYLAETLPLPIVAAAFDRSELRTSLERGQPPIGGTVSSRNHSAPPIADRAAEQTDSSSRPLWQRVASLLFLPWAEERRETPVSYAPSIDRASADLNQGSLNNPVGMMQNFVWGWRLVLGVPRSHKLPRVTVNPAPFQTAPFQTGEDNICRSGSSQGAEAACLRLPVATLSSQYGPTIFQVRVKNQVVAEVVSLQEAGQVAQVLRQVLSDPQLDPTQFQPGFERKLPAAKFRDRVLFTVDPAIAKTWGCNAEVLAVRWVNALRSTLDEAPIALADAQTKMYNLRETESEIRGLASWYGPYFHGRQTATGETFDQDSLTAAHPSLPFDTFLKVTNQKNGKAVVVRVNDRGPYVDNRTLDLSREAARLIDSEQTGVVPIVARVMQPSPSSAAPPQSLAQL